MMPHAALSITKTLSAFLLLVGVLGQHAMAVGTQERQPTFINLLTINNANVCSDANFMTPEACGIENARRWEQAIINASAGTVSNMLHVGSGTFPVAPRATTVSTGTSPFKIICYNTTLNCNITIRGAGMGVTIFKDVRSPGDGSDTIEIRGQNAPITVTLSDFTLEGSPAAPGISLKDGKNVTLERIQVDHAYQGIAILENNFNTKLSNIDITNPQDTGLLVGARYVSPPNLVNTQSNVDTFLSEISIVGDHVPGVSSSNCSYGALIHGGTSGVYAERLSIARCQNGFTTAVFPELAGDGTQRCLSGSFVMNAWWIRTNWMGTTSGRFVDCS